jgi:MFS family permease
MHSNIRKLYLLNLLSGIVFWYPIEKLFLQDIGAGPLGISINALVFLVTLIIFDVPSGVLADKWKRKYTLLLALGCFIIACIMGGASQAWVQYLPMNILLGGFVVLTSGTFQAMMYDSLSDSGHEKDYDKHQGRSYALFLGGLGLSSLAGGYVADWFSMPTTYYLTAVVMVFAVVVAFSLMEPKSHKQVADRKLKEHVKFSVRQIFASRLLLQLALLITAAGVLRGTYNEYSGLLFIALGLTAIPMGYAGAAKWLVSSLGQVVAPKIGRQALKLTPLFFICFLFFSLLQTPWTLVFFYIAGFLYSIIANQTEAAIQDNTPSEIRATTLSVMSFASNVLLVPLGLLFGWIAQQTNVFNAYLMIGVIGVLYLLSWLISGRQALRPLYMTKAVSRHQPTIEAELT